MACAIVFLQNLARFLMQALVEELENKITSLTEEMYAEGNDAATVARIVKDKDDAEARSAKLYQEVRPTLLLMLLLLLLF